MDFGIKEKTCLVTGASRGIGRACAVRLGGEGCKVAVNFREREKEAEETCRLVEEAGGRALPFRADVSRSDEVIGMTGEVAKRLGPIAVLINNAGIARMIAPEDLTEADWDETLSVNLKSAFLMTQAVLPGMRSARWGRIVNVSSNAAFTGGRVGPHYAASKAGMNGLTHAYAASLAGEGITVNSVAPGAIESEMILKDLAIKAPYNPVGRFGHVDEVAEAVLTFVRCGYITGQTLVVSGGIYMT
ncbi:MAG: SDR family NAD(P)-dependent oxidoreductase [bacterium]